MKRKALLAIGFVIVVVIVSGCGVDYIQSKIQEGKSYPIIAIQFAGPSRSHGRDFVRFDLCVKVGEEEWHPHPFFVAWKVEKGETTQVEKVVVTEKRRLRADVTRGHYILWVSAADGEKILQDMEKAIERRDLSSVNAQVRFFLENFS